MSKLLIIPSNKNIDKLLEYGDSFLLGLKDYSVNLGIYFNFRELEDKILEIKKHNKEVFIAINKNVFSRELDSLKDNLIKLSKLNIDGIFYYDQAIYNINKKLDLKLNLVYANEHSNTNYQTINFYNTLGINYFYLSSEITINEIKQIRKKTEAKLILPIFGYIPMFTSVRKVVTNYTKTFDLKNDNEIHYLEKEGNIYPIVEDDFATTYASKILNGYEESLELIDIDYLSLNQFNIDDDKFIKVLETFKGLKNENIDELLDNNTSKHFLHTKTVYKVK